MDRAPIVWVDESLYASVARAVQTSANGVPTMLRDSPDASDHVKFYGPVFFRLAAASFAAFGFSVWSFRIIGVLGAFLIGVAGWLMTRAMCRDTERPLWTLLLLLLTPEVGMVATNGRMDALAVAFELLALAIFVSGLGRKGDAIGSSLAAGVFLALAALTTPRTFPFLLSFGVAGTALVAITPRRRPATIRIFVALLVPLLACAVWSTVAYGGPDRWLRTLAGIGTSDSIEVAIVSGAVRIWWIRPWRLITPAAALLGTVAALLTFRRRPSLAVEDIAALFGLLVGVVTLAIIVAVNNFTFLFGAYFALPLMAVVLSLPRARLPRDGVLTALVVGLIVCDAGVRFAKYAIVATTWNDRDPEVVERFVATNVPRGSDVIGPQTHYFFAVEEAGSNYLTFSPRSWADWTRVATIPPSVHARIAPTPAKRFVLWPDEDALPDGLACAHNSVVARYVPPSHAARQRFTELPYSSEVPGYPAATLYRLPAECAEPRRSP
jgi:4-amino-4-deoxy-L-arabinose transferase-like glycosyltransferase